MKAPAQYAEEDDEPAAPRAKQKKAVKAIPVPIEKLPSHVPLPQEPAFQPSADAAKGTANTTIFATPLSIPHSTIESVAPAQNSQANPEAAHEPVKPTATQQDGQAATQVPKLKLVWRSQGIE